MSEKTTKISIDCCCYTKGKNGEYRSSGRNEEPSSKQIDFIFRFCLNVKEKLGELTEFVEVIKARFFYEADQHSVRVCVIFSNIIPGEKIEKLIEFNIPKNELLEQNEKNIFFENSTKLVSACKTELEEGPLVWLNRGKDRLEYLLQKVLPVDEEQVLYILEQDKELIKILNAASYLVFLWFVGAGTIRNRIWNYLSGKENDPKTQLDDIDLIFFNPSVTEEYFEKSVEKTLNDHLPAKWSAKNQARIHVKNGDKPYESMTDAMSYWPETCTAIGVTLINGKMKLIAPYGIADLVNFIVRPSPKYREAHPDLDKFKKRLVDKKWQEKWPQVKVII